MMTENVIHIIHNNILSSIPLQYQIIFIFIFIFQFVYLLPVVSFSSNMEMFCRNFDKATKNKFIIFHFIPVHFQKKYRY